MWNLKKNKRQKPPLRKGSDLWVSEAEEGEWGGGRWSEVHTPVRRQKSNRDVMCTMRAVANPAVQHI